MTLYLVTYQYAIKTNLGVIAKQTTTRTFRYSELENIEEHIETYGGYIKILSCYKL